MSFCFRSWSISLMKMTVLLNSSTPFTAGTTFPKPFLLAHLYCKVRTILVPFVSVLPWTCQFVLHVHVLTVRKCQLFHSGHWLCKVWMVAFLEVCRWLLGILEVELGVSSGEDHHAGSHSCAQGGTSGYPKSS